MIKLTKRYIFPSIISCLLLFMAMDVSYSGVVEEAQERVQNGSPVMRSGWINIDIQRARALKEATRPKNEHATEENVEYINRELGESLAEDTTAAVTPDIKKKTGEGESVSLEEGTIFVGYDINGDGEVTDADTEAERSDVNKDGVINKDDKEIIKEARKGPYNPDADINQDGIVDKTDEEIVHGYNGLIIVYVPVEEDYQTIVSENIAFSHLDTYWRNVSDLNRYGEYGSSSPTFAATMPPEEEATNPLSAQNNERPEEGKPKIKMVEAPLTQIVLDLVEEEIPLTNAEEAEEESVITLASILNSPAEEKEAPPATIEEGVAEAQSVIQKISNDFKALLNLFKTETSASLRAVFSELINAKSRIVFAYLSAIKEYYNSFVKDLASKVATFHIKDLLSRRLSKKEPDKLPPERIDEILNPPLPAE